MMRFSRYFMILLAATALAGIGVGEPMMPGVTFVLSLEEAEPMVFSPVVLEIRIENGFETDVHVDLGVDNVANYRFSLVDSDGRILQTAVPKVAGFHFAGGELLPPGGRLDQTILLNEMFRFESPGKYELRVEFLGKIESVNGRQVSPVLPESVPLTLREYSRRELAETCRELADTARKGDAVEQALDAATRLSFVRHPEAVAYLAELFAIDFEPIQYQAGQGMIHIGGEAAIDALVVAYREGKGPAPRIARNALLSIRHRLTDPALVRRIDEILKSNR